MNKRMQGIVNRSKATAESATQTYSTLRRHSHLIQFLEDMFWRYKRTNISMLMGGLAYRIFLFVLPCMLIVVAFAGYTTSSGGDAGEPISDVRLSAALRGMMTHAGSDASGGWQLALTVGLIGVVVGGYGLYSALFGAFAQIWELPLDVTKKKVKTSLRFIVGLFTFFGFLYGLAWVRNQGLLFGTLGFFVSISVDMMLFLALSMALPHRGTGWVNLVPGALGGGAGTIGLQIAAATWVPYELQNRTATYGTLGIAVVVLVYLALLGFVLCSVPLINATWYKYIEAHPLPTFVQNRNYLHKWFTSTASDRFKPKST